MFNTHYSVLLCMTDEKSLLRCTVVKSLHTAGHLLVYVAYCIVGLAIAGCVGYIGYLGIPKLSDAIWVVYSVCVTLIFSMPPIVYVIVGIPTVIVAYSFVWCVARELTISDWASREADDAVAFAAFAAVAVAVAFVAVSAFAFAFVAVSAFAFAFVAVSAFAFAAFAFAFAFVAAVAAVAAFAAAFAFAAVADFAVAAAVAADYEGTALQKIVRFAGAYYHYHNRIKSGKSE